MPLTITNKNFEDIFSNDLSFYQSNAGDTQTFTCNLSETIEFVSSPTVIFYLNPVTYTITIVGGNYLTEGFRAGDTVRIRAYNSNGSIKGTTSRTILSLTSTEMTLSGSVDHWHDSSQGEFSIITIVYTEAAYPKRNGLWLDVNHVQNGLSGNEFSLIDGEVTRFTFNLTGTTFNQVVNGVQTGLKSGQFNVVCTLQDKTTYPNNVRRYILTVGIIQSGIYDSSNFDFSNCLKLYLGFNWQRTYNDPNNMYKYVISDDANNGWFDEAYNVGTINATLVQGINELDYSVGSSGQISIDSTSSSFGFGASYVPKDASYFDSQPYTQSQLGMTCPTQTGTAPITITSSLNPNGAGYTIVFSNPVTVGTITTWDYEFTPNAQFTTFIDSRVDNDKLFYVWAKYGSVNLLLFDGQLTKEAQQGDPLDVIQHDFVDHSENIITTTNTQSGFSGNVEDDIAFIGKFLVDDDADITYTKAEIYAVDTTGADEFLLTSIYFDFTSVPKVLGKYPINQSIQVITTLPSTSLKLNAIIERDSSIDTATKYGFKIYIPFFYKWEYWLSQPNANAIFYPNNQTQNWVPYGNTDDWKLKFRITSNINGLDSIFEDELIINDYDSNSNVDQSMDLILVSSNQVVDVIVENELHKIKAYHGLNVGTWNQSFVWGMITIEPTESNPRWICSTVVPFDNNLSNPLTPIFGLYPTLTFPSANIALIECYFDPNKINLSNGVKFTSKIKQNV